MLLFATNAPLEFACFLLSKTMESVCRDLTGDWSARLIANRIYACF